MMRRWFAAAIAAALLAGCGGDDDESSTPSAGDAAATATQAAPAPRTTPTSTTGQAPPGPNKASRGGRPEQRAVQAVRDCLSQQGYKVTGGVRPPGDPDAPDHEILVAGPRGSAFIAFYSALAAAKRYEARLRRNAGRFKGASVERQGTITTVWVGLTDAAARARIRECVRQES